MAKKWSEIRRQLSPEAEARIRQKVADKGIVLALHAAETDPKLRELAETDSEAYLRYKRAHGEAEPVSS